MWGAYSEEPFWGELDVCVLDEDVLSDIALRSSMIYWKGIQGALVEVERTRTYSRVNLAEENAFNSLQISDYFKCVEFQSEYFLQN